jgi:hypothetical protein
MALRVEVICRNLGDDRVIPRFARYLRDRLGWSLAPAGPSDAADVTYLSVYFETQVLNRWPDHPVAAYFTHREVEPPGNDKAKLFDAVAAKVQLRVATAQMYADILAPYGPTAQIPAPVERERFLIAPRPAHAKPVVGLSGYTYQNKRKGEDLLRAMLESKVAERVEWRASGRGWGVYGVPTHRYAWEEMPSFYQGLDVLVVTSRVEGVPMPPLEALSCGVPVVIPRGVGLHDELPDVPGIYRYEMGDVASLVAALQQACYPDERPEAEALRAAVAPYSVEAWCEEHAAVMEREFGSGAPGVRATHASPLPAGDQIGADVAVGAPDPEEPVDMGTGSTRGIYCVAFGQMARDAAEVMMRSAKTHMPDVPICLCAASPLGIEDVFVRQPDSDIGGRRAKLKVYELAPAEWQTVLYLDADTEVTTPVYQLFKWAESGWDMVICKDISPNDVLGRIQHKVIPPEAQETQRIVGTWDVLQLNGGVWAFQRNAETAAFFRAWRAEWERWAQRDQGALIRALYSHPLRMLVLGNEWNAFPKFQNNQASAGILHYPGEARRWVGQIPGRLDEPQAWEAVRRFEQRRGVAPGRGPA